MKKCEHLRPLLQVAISLIVLLCCVGFTQVTAHAEGYTGLGVGEDQQWHYFSNGSIDWNYSGLVPNEYGWWKVTDGTIDFSYNGLTPNEYGWWKITNGAVDFGYTGITPNEYGWWKITNGAVDFGYTGVASNEFGWWYISNGMLDWNYTGVAPNEYGWWYIKDGALDWSYTGIACNEAGWWYIKDGALDWSYTGIANNEYGWWYIRNGALDFGYEGLGHNDVGDWYYKNGQIAFDFTGIVNIDGIQYQVINGLATQYQEQQPSEDFTVHTHNYIVLDKKDPSCTDNGFVRLRCSCGDEQLKIYPALGHDYQLINEENATCGHDGYREYKCSRCGDIHRETVLQLGHDYQLSKTVDATCVRSGYQEYKCTHCGDTYRNVISALGHDYQLIKRVDATCTTQGYEEYKCTRCGDTYKINIPALGHSLSDWIITKQPTDTQDGERVIKCSTCGEIMERQTLTRIGSKCSLDNSSQYFKYEYAYRYKDQSMLTSEDDKTFVANLTTCLNQAYQYTTMYEREKAVHDYIVLNCKYDYDNYLADTIPISSYSAAGVFVNKTAVCDGYCKAFKLAMDILGIPCIRVTGTANGGGHAWNAVQLDNEWYMVDVTWDDPVPDEEGIISYGYFNVTDDSLKLDHQYTCSISATGTKYYYYNMEKDNIIYFSNTDNIDHYYNRLKTQFAKSASGTVVEIIIERTDGVKWTYDNMSPYMDGSRSEIRNSYSGFSCSYGGRILKMYWTVQ